MALRKQFIIFVKLAAMNTKSQINILPHDHIEQAELLGRVMSYSILSQKNGCLI